MDPTWGPSGRDDQLVVEQGHKTLALRLSRVGVEGRSEQPCGELSHRAGNHPGASRSLDEQAPERSPAAVIVQYPIRYCAATMQSDLSKEDGAAGMFPSHGISLDLPTADDYPPRPAIVSHLYDYVRTV